MSYISLNSMLLADSRLRAFSGGFKPGENQQGPGSVLTVLCVILVFIVLLWFLARLADRRRERGPTNSPLILLVTLCRAHGLSWRDCFLVWRLARRHRLKDPARLFLEPERFDTGTGRASRGRSGRLQAIKARVFAGLAKDEPSTTGIPVDGVLKADTSAEAAAPLPFPLLASQPIGVEAPASTD
jgi:hypothetical protein